MIWAEWWVWLVGAVALATLEIFLPGFIFVGFAAGAAVTGLLIGVGGPVSAWLASSLAATLLVFATVSLVSWIALRKIVGVREGQIKYWDRDINED